MSKARDFPYWLLAATLLAYLNALSAGFQFDDFNVIVDNPAVHSLAAWWDGMPGIRPLLKLSYTLNWLADPGPAGFHAVNLALHGINVALVWRLTRHFPAPAGGESRTMRLVATLLFALHPIQTESVTYVSGRSMTLMAAFGLAGLLAWLEAPTHRRPWAWQGSALLLFAAAILSKEVAVVLPVALLLFTRRAWLPALLAGLALVALFLGFGYTRLLAEPMPRDLASNLLSELNAVYYLIGQLFQPYRLNIDPMLPELDGWTPALLFQAGLLAGLILISALQRVAWPWLGFSLAWFILLLLPTHSLIPRLDLASERHFYLAALGLYWLAGIAARAWLNHAGLRVLLVTLTLAGIVGTHLRNRDYRDEISLWRQTTALSPGHARAWNNLGWAYLLAERHSEARAAFVRALAADPGHVQARRNLDYLDRKATP